MLEKDVRDFFFKTKENYNLIVGQTELNIDGLRIDVFAVDNQGNPFIIEFKKDKNRHIVGQSAHYLALIPTKHKEIEKKLQCFNINWNNLKVLCIAKSFNQRDFDALNFDPIKGRVYLYEYKIVKDYRQNSIFGIDLFYTGDSSDSPLYIPEKPTNQLDFAVHFKQLTKIDGKENKRQYYTNTILPLLNQVANELNKKYADIKMYSHISYFQGGPHVLFRLGLDKEKSHRAAIAVTFIEDIIESGFDITHSIMDAQSFKNSYNLNKDTTIDFLLSLKDYEIWIPNSGIKSTIYIEDINHKGIDLLVNNYNPVLNKDCYLRITKASKKTTLTTQELVMLFDEEYHKFKYLFEQMKNYR